MSLGKKSSSINPGILWAPYIMVENVSVISESFSPKQVLKSRYSRVFLAKQIRRKEKIKKILKETP